MSRNGSGTYAAPASSWNPAIIPSAATTADWNALLADLSASITQSMSRDGQSPPTADMPWGGFGITGLRAAATNGEAVRYEQVGALASAQITSLAILRNYFSGCGLSTAGSSATMSIAAGSVMDSTNTTLMTLTAIAKTTASWAVGTAAGGLDTGAIANNTWYHFYAIRRTDTGVVDVVFSTNATSPTLPASYTQYRAIGSGKTNGSAQWTGFTQVGNRFSWTDPVADVGINTSGGTTASTPTLAGVPLGVVTFADLTVSITVQTTAPSNAGVYVSPISSTDTAPTAGLFTAFAMLNAAQDNAAFNSLQVATTTAAVIRFRPSAASSSITVRIITKGWIDPRIPG